MLLLVWALAAWRISYALVREQGPWGLLTRLRETTGIVHDEAGRPLAVPDGNVLGCVWCFSVWAAAVLLAVPVIVCMVFAVSAMVIIIHERLVK